jgi:hypothetical protein
MMASAAPLPKATVHTELLLRHDGGVSASIDPVLDAVAVEIETYIAARGWDGPPTLFALVETSTLMNDPESAAALGLGDPESVAAGSLTPVEQDELPAEALDEALAQIAWPEQVVGCAVSQEIVFLPPDAEDDLPDGSEAVGIALTHERRREARLVVAVHRDGRSAGIIRLRGENGAPDDEVLYGSSLAPNLVEALMLTFD